MTQSNPDHSPILENDDPSEELLSESYDPYKTWVFKAMDERVIPKYSFWSRGTIDTVSLLRESAAQNAGIVNTGSVYEQGYWHATVEERAHIDAALKDKVAEMEANDPKVRAASELFKHLLDTIDQEQGPLYDVIIRLTQWATDKEVAMINEGVEVGMLERTVNDTIQSGFLGLYEVYLVGKGLPTYE